MSTDLTAGERARFDQIHAMVGDTLDAFIAAHRGALDEDHELEVSIAGLAAFLGNTVSHHACAELLAVAVDRLTRGQEDPHV